MPISRRMDKEAVVHIHHRILLSYLLHFYTLTKKIPLTIAWKIPRDLTEEAKDLYTENCKILIKEIKMTQINGKILCAHGLENIIKMSILHKSIYRFNVILIKLPMAFFIVINIPIICGEPQKIPNRQSNLKNEEQSWRHHAPRYQSILQSYSSKNSMILAKNPNVNCWNRIESQEINPHTDGQL